MTKKAPISICMIVKNEPLLEKSILSIRDHVEEVVIVDTGSTDGTEKIAKKYADIFKTYADCNDPQTGLIENFSQARQYSFDLATQPWTMWADADDIIEGAENLNKIITVHENKKHEMTNIDDVAFLFPYEYSYDGNGQCTCRHYRERLFSNKKAFHWVNPVHEVVVPNNNDRTSLITVDDVLYKHQRQFSQKIGEPGRNLRILRKYFEKVGDTDARQMYYLGLECCNAGLIEEGTAHLIKYISISGWDDERVMACLKLVDLYQALNQYSEGLKWAFKAVEINEQWGECYFAIARMFYYLALAGGHNEFRNWERCAYFAKTGLTFPPTRTLLFVNPRERDVEIHKYLNMALNKLGRVQEALNSVNTGLQAQPTDENLLNNKKLYEEFLFRNDAIIASNKLKDVGAIDQNDIVKISAILNKQPIEQYPSYKKSETYPKNVTDEQFPVAAQTPHSQAWSIPNAIEMDGLPLRMTNDQLQATVIMIWKQYILHDEILSAKSFLENAPFNVRDTKITQDALKITHKMMGWLKEPDMMQKYNAPNNPDVEIDVPLPYPLANNQSGGRFNLVVSNLPNNKTSIIDFGCADGCFTNRYGLLGHEVYGLDLVETSVALANKKAIEFNTGAKHVITYFQDASDKVPNNYFDYATSTDTYEHVMNPVEDIFLPAKKMLKADGKFLMCTPYGSWMRGNFLPWAHPWLWGEEGHHWLFAHPRGHLIAPSAWSVIKHFRQAEYHVQNCYPVLCSPSDVPDQGNIFAEAHVKGPDSTSGLEIVFYVGDGVEHWTPQSIKKTGIGGSETAAYQMAKRLSALGHKVKMYNGCGPHGEGIYDGVEYYQSHKYQDIKCDILIVSRRADMLDDKYTVQAKIKLLWVHDIFALNATNALLLKADRILALSNWHKQNLINYHTVHADQIITTRNGIDLTRFDKKVDRDRYKCVNSSSPDRSWPALLNIWPEIKKRVPQASLHLYYGFKNWKFAAQFQPGHSELINRLEQQIQNLKSLDVIFHDRVSQEQLAEEFLGAGCLLYPTWFSETSYIGGMEAQAAGLRIITSPIAAINDTIGPRGTLIEGDWTSDEYKNKFVDASVNAMTSEDSAARAALQVYAHQNFGMDELAKEWNTMFYDLINKQTNYPLAPYQPTTDYRKS